MCPFTSARRRIRTSMVSLILLALTSVLGVASAPPTGGGPGVGALQVGASFSIRRASYLGLDYREAFHHLLGMRFGLERRHRASNPPVRCRSLPRPARSHPKNSSPIWT